MGVVMVVARAVVTAGAAVGAVVVTPSGAARVVRDRAGAGLVGMMATAGQGPGLAPLVARAVVGRAGG